jgi:hypothetical protein
MLYVTQTKLDEHMARLKENVPNGVCCTYEARPGKMVELVAVRVGLCEFPNELLQLECSAPNIAINMCDRGCDAEVYLQGRLVGEACIEDIDALMCIALKVALCLYEMHKSAAKTEVKDDVSDTAPLAEEKN